MLAPDPDTLLYLHNNPPEQQDSVVAPITDALRRAWDGNVLVANLRDVQVWLGPAPRVTIAGRDVLPVRTYARIFNPTYGPALTQALRALGSRVVNCPDAVAVAISKFESAAVLHAAGLPVPQQVLFPSDPYPEVLAAQSRLGWPRIIKANQGRGGTAVWRVTSDDEISGHAHGADSSEPYVAQEYQADAAGRDVRVLVVDGRIAAAMERRSTQSGEFRANLALNGTGHPVDLSQTEADVAVRAAQALGLTVAGVDLLRTASGPMLTEVNPNPALTGISTLFGDDRLYDAVARAVTSA